MAQHSVDMAGDLCSILGADVPAISEIVGRNIVRRPISRVDRSENVDRRRDLRTGRQIALVSVSRGPSPSR
jgi:hypothetical protein